MKPISLKTETRLKGMETLTLELVPFYGEGVIFENRDPLKGDGNIGT